MKDERGLTPKQAKFIEEYLIDFNGKQAAIRAGYKPDNAVQTANENLRKPHVASALAIRKRQVAESRELTPEKILEELCKVAFANMRDFVRWEQGEVKLIPSDELGADLTAAISEVSLTATQAGRSVRFKLHDKIRALEHLGRYFELFTYKHTIDATQAAQRIAALLDIAA